MITCYNDNLLVLIKYVVRIKLTFFWLFKKVTRRLQIMSFICIIFQLDSTYRKAIDYLQINFRCTSNLDVLDL